MKGESKLFGGTGWINGFPVEKNCLAWKHFRSPLNETQVEQHMLRIEGGSRMVPIFGQDELVMLEDFIGLAKDGEEGNLPTLTCRPWSFASCSVRPMLAI